MIVQHVAVWLSPDCTQINGDLTIVFALWIQVVQFEQAARGGEESSFSQDGSQVVVMDLNL